jgi:SAM-dependent methyltransferase
VPVHDAPVPPANLAVRVGSVEGADPVAFYLKEGAAVRERIEQLLPPQWSFEGKRVLDFGCGSARVLRHFLDEAEGGEFWGCDIDASSIDWVNANLNPPLHCFQNEHDPPLAFDDEYLDLIWATSVFTHIDRWSTWLLELHRVLAPDGLLIASFLGEGIWDALVGEPYREDQVGMTVLHHWRDGGPGAEVFHSEWWLREHWGRAFEVLEVVGPPRTPNGAPEITHSYIALRKRQATPTQQELEWCNPSEPRELAALQTSVRLLRREIDELVARGHSKRTLREALLRSPLGDPARRLRNRFRAAAGVRRQPPP